MTILRGEEHEEWQKDREEMERQRKLLHPLPHAHPKLKPASHDDDGKRKETEVVEEEEDDDDIDETSIEGEGDTVQ